MAKIFVLVAAAALAAVLAPACAAPAGEQPRSYAGHTVLRLTPHTQSELEHLKRLAQPSSPETELDFWRPPTALGRPVDVRLSPAQARRVKPALDRLGVDYSVMVEDVQALADTVVMAPTRTDGSINITEYNTYETIRAWVLTLNSTYPDLVTVTKLGETYEGRDLLMVKITSNKNANKPGFWMDSLIHAREWITGATIVWMMNEILTQYGKDNDLTSIVDSSELYFLPVFNADGYVYTQTDRMWRKTRSPHGICKGVDPNRNWDFHWAEAGASANPCSDSYEGPKAFSEIEVKTVGEYVVNTTNIAGYINFHSYSQLFMSPWGYTSTLPPDTKEQVALAKAAVTALGKVYNTQYDYGPIATTIYPASGSSADYTYGVGGVVWSYGVELRDTGKYGFLLPASEIVPSGVETLEAVKVVAKQVIAEPARRKPSTA